jgi:NitT/TauT family transport system substrate-binding protein
MKRYKVSEECISCRACVEVAPNHFAMNEDQLAYVKKQAQNEDDEQLCEEALETCPVNAIFVEEQKVDIQKSPILASSNIKETLDKYPQLKDILVDLSPKFKRMQNPALYNTLARFANFNDAAKITGLSVCEILHTMNEHIGTADQLVKNMPECVKKVSSEEELVGEDISWEEAAERYIYNNDTVDEMVKKVSDLGPQENIVVISVDLPNELLKIAKGLGYQFNVEKGREFRLSIFNPQKAGVAIPWQERKDDFEVLEVRKMKTDPFDLILKKAYATKEGEGFMLKQTFEPIPMINMLDEMGFEHVTDKKGIFEYWVYFYKVPTLHTDKKPESEKVDVVIQSATPVAYPVIMKLLQSEKIRNNVNIRELKVWEETEKHLAWITTGKADISFSALITSAKLRNSDIKIPALFVWDNFVMLSRDKAKGFEDLKGQEIATPLFEEAPPAKITKYLIQAKGLDPKDFTFVYGKPFGRPEEIYQDFVTGKANTVILREPEASYAIKTMRDRKEEISIISYNEIWNQVNPGFGSFPNAGLVLKGEFARQHPEITQVLLDELKDAIQWVNNNHMQSARLSFDMMRQPVDRIELFLDRVNFEYVEGEPLVESVKQYFDILNAQGIVDMKIDKEFLDVFRMDV